MTPTKIIILPFVYTVLSFLIVLPVLAKHGGLEYTTASYWVLFAIVYIGIIGFQIMLEDRRIIC